MHPIEAWLRDNGQACTINGVTPSFVSLRKVGARTDLNYIENFKEGLILLDSGLASGNTLTVVDNGITTSYLCITSQLDRASEQIAFQVAKINTSLTIKRYEEQKDSYGNTVPGSETWGTVATNIPAYAGVSFQRMVQEDPGMVPQQIFQVILQSVNDVQLLDRIVFSGQSYQVDTIDPVSSPGNNTLLISHDTRN